MRSSVLALGLVFGACAADRESVPATPVFDADVAPIFTQRCARCHGGETPAAGWASGSYLGAIGCVMPLGAPAILPPNDAAPIARALADATHAGFASAQEQTAIEAWLGAGAPAFRAGVHDPQIADPRSPAFHGTSLRAARWTPMLDPRDPDACGRCHDATLARPQNVTLAAPGAPSCASCHDQPNGIFACGTCHGDGPRSAPPRDPCFFPSDTGGAHAAHLGPSRVTTTAMTCATCHPVPNAGPAAIGGAHGDGVVDVVFDPARVEAGATYDRVTGRCTVSCHDQGGVRARPAWADSIPMTCNDCHRAPPADHPPGACSSCHAEANAAGTALVPGPLHLNGRIDLGDGSGGCGACHGHGADAWPSTAAHGAHRDPAFAAAVDCASCHPVPGDVFAAGHMNGTVDVRFAGGAVARAAQPQWDGATCADVACHGARLADTPRVLPAWTDTSGRASACGACHAIPPAQHTTSTSCDRATCHGAEVSRASGAPAITPSGRLLHVNGIIDVP